MGSAACGHAIGNQALYTKPPKLYNRRFHRFYVSIIIIHLEASELEVAGARRKVVHDGKTDVNAASEVDIGGQNSDDEMSDPASCLDELSPV